MSTLNALVSACQTEPTTLLDATRERVVQWSNWLQPLPGESSVGDDPGYDDGFQQMREEVNKLSGADTELICQLAEKVLTTTAKDIRVATYYCWARLHREGEQGLAEGLELLAGLIDRFGAQLHPQRNRSRKAALEWLAGSRMTDSLSLYPEVVREDALRTIGALLLIAQLTENEPDETRPELNALYGALENRLQKAGGVDAVVPQNASTTETLSTASHSDAPAIGRITSGQDLLAQARTLSEYLREQPDGWLSAHHLMKSLRHDTLQAIPAPDAQGRTRIEPPRADQRALLKRLYLQQNWAEILETADSTFSRGANHLWLDLQWYIHQALTKSGKEIVADIIAADLKGLLTRLSGLETLAFSDGTPFADEVTLNWIQQSVLDTTAGWGNETPSARMAEVNDDILALESEAVALADSESPDAALSWLQHRPGIATARQQWLLRLLMGRIAEQYGKNELAVHLFAELGERATEVALSDWEPELLFEVQARHLKLLRLKASRSEADKIRLGPAMEKLLGGLIQLDPARAAVLCG
ncbi:MULTISPECIES: type VI secretion system protein TssA [unclassified Escherichia]|uniref:type VI secretion system protein TssA n=1 Tax=unclassified Escherichia TaxID=2608889 RepID=UPI001029B297|nr:MULTISPECIES: type VI secretion system protein TssA [unclassified Escherichia]RZN19928.1 type VI secretion system protein TssA [Escherichia sp. E14S1]TGB95301.1 type VI secretion system protein TssA [Escherichia sp. E3356]TGC15976.1 type VI secretion system protein TssA [Escherichia sp. E2562]TLI86571.1 type VI secretion system protein TssA [Escherichia sp. E2562]